MAGAGIATGLTAAPTPTVATGATNAAVVATAAGVASMQQNLLHAHVSFSAAAGAATTILVKSATTTIWRVEVSVGILFYDLDFQVEALQAAKGEDLTVTVGAIGGTTVSTVSMLTKITRAP